jgi:hypothetical protein
MSQQLIEPFQEECGLRLFFIDLYLVNNIYTYPYKLTFTEYILVYSPRKLSSLPRVQVVGMKRNSENPRQQKSVLISYLL